MTHAISVQGLTHQFTRKSRDLDCVALQVPPGSIYGFLGPNGAGKTTTIRLLLGLLPLQAGEVEFFGQPFRENRLGILCRVGSLIESPSVYGHLTARENLQVFQHIYRCPEKRIEEVLELVALADTGNKKTGQFSLGMKQRLGIATALLHDPEVIILDEPTNGLDPNGIIEVRDLLLRLHQQAGKTILVSSHLLAEVEKLATHVGVIHHGRMLFEGTLAALRATQQQLTKVTVRCSKPEALATLLAGRFQAVVHDNGQLEVAVNTPQQVAELAQLAVANGIDLYELRTSTGDLESIFMQLINA